jgi:hypothetical protein
VKIVDELGWLFLAFASTVVAAWVTLILVVRAFFRRVRRNLALNGAALRFRARLSTGPRREVLKLRLRLQETLDSGQAAVDLAVGNGVPSGELPRLFRRLRSEGSTLESQLRLLESENDPAVLAELLPAARDRVEQVSHLVRHVRSAVGTGLGTVSDDSLNSLRSDVDREVTAVRAGMQELHELNQRGALTEPGRHPSTGHLTN